MTGPSRRITLVQATALNMINMIGIGPFITIPLLMSALGGPQALIGWLAALVLVIADGMVWSELGAALPRSGGTFGYLRAAFGDGGAGRLIAFLFVWQFLLSGPLEIASGYIGFASYLGYLWPGSSAGGTAAVIVAVGLLNVALLYRPIASIGTITVALWVGVVLAALAVVATGARRFDPALAFDFPAGAFEPTLGFALGLGAAARIGVYDYLGYYNVCFIGSEVEDPGRTIPRSILLSTLAVAALYIAINLSIIGVLPWRQFVPAAEHPESGFIVSVLMERVHGPRVAAAFTVLILWTAFASVFALLLGYSRVPFAAAQDGYFFKAFGRVHPDGGFPHVALIALGLLAILASFLTLGVVIDALITMRILVQFAGQVAALVTLRRTRPDLPRPYRMWLYPLPALTALAGWLFLFATSGRVVLVAAIAWLAAGVACYEVWRRRMDRSPARE